MKNQDLVTIIMISHNNGTTVEKSLKSILTQTYENWELLFVDDASQDDTINKALTFRGKDDRIIVSHTVYENGPAFQLNSALRDAKGRWIAFIRCGDIWCQDKLEKQVRFMEKNDYSFSYTKFQMQSESGVNHGTIIGGKRIVNYSDMLKCCWLCFPTVMYDASKVGCMQVKNLLECNDYALWIKVAKNYDCYLLNECLTTQLTNRHLFSPFPINFKIRWRYEVYHTEMGMNPITSALMTVRCLWNGIVKKIKYSEKTK
jgi:glycosyltransferase involved in cell wall biosynthesis